MKKSAGFTIIELLVAIGIAGILMSIAVPNFRVAIRNNCMTTSVNLLVTSVQYARSEAIKLRQNVRLTAGSSLGVAVTDNTNEWGTGWYVWADANASGVYDAGEELRIFTPACSPVMDETGNDDEFIYDLNGFVDTPGSIDVCMDYSNERGRQLTISTTGRPTVASDFTCSAGGS